MRLILNPEFMEWIRTLWHHCWIWFGCGGGRF